MPCNKYTTTRLICETVSLFLILEILKYNELGNHRSEKG